MVLRYRYSLFEKMQDITASIRGLWFLILFNIIALYAFLFAPQGTDVLLCIAEDIGGTQNFILSTFSLLAALFFWSVASEFSSRLLIYLTDTSGRLLDPARVVARKKYQRIISRTLLYFPVMLMMVAFIKAYSFNHNDLGPASKTIFGIFAILFLLLAEMVLLFLLYRKRWIVKLSVSNKRFQWMSISTHEKIWVTKLYGMLNHVRIDADISLPFDGNDLRDDPVHKQLINFPAPECLEPYSCNPDNKHDAGKKIWLYRINLRFYRSLLRQLTILGAVAVFIILMMSFVLPAAAFFAMGSAAIICLAFACWQIVYVCLHFFDKYQSKFPVRFFLLVMLIITSFYSRDHEVRSMQKRNVNNISMQQHFDSFYRRLATDTTGKYFRVNSNTTASAQKDSIPVIFVAAEGGALRTGAFTALMLAALQDSFPQLKKHIWCYSSVSGGTLGVNYFNAAALQQNKDTGYGGYAKEFFKKDFLAAVTAKLMFGEIINSVIPHHFEQLDRAVTLERAWETAWPADYPQNEGNLLSSPFDTLINMNNPALFINTTEAESGQQCIWSNVLLKGLPLERERDLRVRTKLNMPYSTAINISARFPLIAPGATMFFTDSSLKKNPSMRRHFVDGGYYENRGSETLLQVMQALQLSRYPVKPYVIQFNFGDDLPDTGPGIRSFNEIKEIVTAIYKTRGGRANIAQYYLKKYTESIGGKFIDLHLAQTTGQIPMNWILSNTAIDRLSQCVDKSIRLKADDKRELMKLFFYSRENERGK